MQDTSLPRLSACVRCAQAPRHSIRFVVRDIRVEGIQRIEAGTVFSYLPVKVGETMTDEKAAAAIKRAVRDRILQGRAPRGAARRAGRHGRGAAGDRVRSTSSASRNSRKTQLKKGLREAGLAEGRTFDRALLDQAEQELKRQYLARGQYARQRGHHGHAARAQPRRRQLLHRRRRGHQDPRDQHRRQPGVQGEGPAASCSSLQHAGLDDLVHQERPVFEAEAVGDLETLRSYLPEPRLPRIQHRVDAGVDHAGQERHLHHHQHHRRREVHGLGRQARRRHAAARGRDCAA